MTTREFYETIIASVDNAEIVAKATELMASLDKKNSKRNEKLAEQKRLENEPLMAKIVECLNGKGFTPASEIKDFLEVNVNKASALCRKMTETGTLVSSEIKVGGRKVKGYKLP